MPDEPPPFRSRNPYLELGNQHNQVKTFTLPVSGSVILFGPEIDVVDTPEFQRLGGIKQLGTSYVVYRGALHTRLDHSLGALHEADRMLRAVQSNPRDPYPVSDRALRLARLGALLHDLPHVPFGHTLEDELYLLRRHDSNPQRMKRLLLNSKIGHILRKALGDDFGELVKVLQAKNDSEIAALKFPFVGDVVGNTVCADLMDYCQRDLISCGLPIALGDHFLDYLSVTRDDEGLLEDHRRLVVNLDKGGMPRPDVESEIVSLLTHRYELAERVYFHHAKNSASVMIGRAVQEAGWAAGVHGGVNLDRNFLWLSDEMLLAALADPAIADALALRSAAEHDGDRRLASELAKGVRTRRLYKMAFLATWEDNPHAVGRITKEHGGDPVKRRQFEDGLADLAALRRGHVLVHIPGQQMMRKDADVRVRTGQGEVVKLHEWDRSHSKRLAALNEAHERLWRVMVFVHPDDEAAIPVVRAAAQDEFRSASRLVPRDDVSEYSRALFADLTTRWRLAVEDAEALQHAAYVRSEGRRAAERAILGAVRLQRRLSGQPQLRRR